MISVRTLLILFLKKKPRYQISELQANYEIIQNVKLPLLTLVRPVMAVRRCWLIYSFDLFDGLLCYAPHLTQYWLFFYFSTWNWLHNKIHSIASENVLLLKWTQQSNTTWTNTLLKCMMHNERHKYKERHK